MSRLFIIANPLILFNFVRFLQLGNIYKFQKFWIYLSALCVVMLVLTEKIRIHSDTNDYVFVYLELFSIFEEDSSLLQIRFLWHERRHLLQSFVVVHTSDGRSRRSFVILRSALVMNEEEGEEHEIGDWESDPGYHIDRLRYSNRMRRILFPQLQEKKFRYCVQTSNYKHSIKKNSRSTLPKIVLIIVFHAQGCHIKNFKTRTYRSKPRTHTKMHVGQ